jgi:hypothetical protein
MGGQVAEQAMAMDMTVLREQRGHTDLWRHSRQLA